MGVNARLRNLPLGAKLQLGAGFDGSGHDSWGTAKRAPYLFGVSWRIEIDLSTLLLSLRHVRAKIFVVKT